MPSKQFWLGSAAGAGILLVAVVGIAAALGHPVPHIFKKVPDKVVDKNIGLVWSLIASASDQKAEIVPISVSQAKQIADVLKSGAFQVTPGNPNGVMFIPHVPADGDSSAATGSSYYVKAL